MHNTTSCWGREMHAQSGKMAHALRKTDNSCIVIGLHAVLGVQPLWQAERVKTCSGARVSRDSGVVLSVIYTNKRIELSSIIQWPKTRFKNKSLHIKLALLEKYNYNDLQLHEHLFYFAWIKDCSNISFQTNNFFLKCFA